MFYHSKIINFNHHQQEKMSRLFAHADLDANGGIDCVDAWIGITCWLMIHLAVVYDGW